MTSHEPYRTPHNKTLPMKKLRIGFDRFFRNGRDGTCVSCPRDGDGNVLPELCEHTDRGDHHIDLVSLVSLIVSECHGVQRNATEKVLRKLILEAKADHKANEAAHEEMIRARAVHYRSGS